ncbi:MAG: hypothetical protein ORN51_00665 [Akkermansiaceae bacterium]|nr:hypothetical protein [Akkermansiaceae bacterium]
MNDYKETEECVELWNPNTAANWCLLFSPIFGAWIHAKNWQGLNQPDKAKKSMLWVYFGFVFFLVILVLPDNPRTPSTLIFLFTWYFLSARDQVKYVKDHNIQYRKKAWGRPLLLGVLGIAGWCSIVIGVEMVRQPAFSENGGESQNEQLFSSECATFAAEEQSLNEAAENLLEKAKSGILTGPDAAELCEKKIASKWAEMASRFEEISIPSSSQSAQSHQIFIDFCKTRRDAYRALSDGLMTDSEDKVSEYNSLMQKAENLIKKAGDKKD